MSDNFKNEVIKTSLHTVLNLLSDSESDDSDDDIGLPSTNSDLCAALLIYASKLSNYGDNDDDDDAVESVLEMEIENYPSPVEVTTKTTALEDERFCDEEETPINRHLEQRFSFPGFPEFTSMASISDIDFKLHFGVNKSTVELLLGMLPDKSPLGRPQVNDLVFVLVSLWFLVTSEPHNAIADRFRLGKSHSHRIVVDFCTHLTNISSEFITWPDRTEAMTTIDTFKNNYGFPGVMGVLSNCHMNIKCPAFDALNYNNASGKYSVYLQSVVLPSLHFSYVFAGWPGSCTDEEVLFKSPLFSRLFREPSTWVPDASHLLTRGAFTLQTFLLTPYQDNGCLNSAQTIYNSRHSQVCLVADYALGLLRNRFTRLSRLEVLKMDLLTRIIVTCCVLHNICLEEGDTFQDLVSEASIESGLDFEIASPEAELKRDTIANTFLLS